MIGIIACEVMKEELLAVATERPVAFRFVSMGLHRWPERLREELRRLLGETTGCEAVVLAFGLCGGAVAGLRAPGVPLAVPRAHDCIPLLVGSPQAYAAVRAEEQGTLYLSGGWLEGERTLLSEYRRSRERFGEAKARRIMATMLDGYRRLLFLDTGHPRQEQRREEARELAALLSLDFCVRRGRDAWLARLVNGPWDGEDFVLIGPGEELREEYFAVPAGDRGEFGPSRNFRGALCNPVVT
ncbi:MAG TPA: DUF1638 domain-containing protein [Geobacteraceae bacterium]